VIFVNKYITLFVPMFLIYCLVEEINIFYLFYFILYIYIEVIYRKIHISIHSAAYLC
jgi:hypothetical protein